MATSETPPHSQPSKPAQSEGPDQPSRPQESPKKDLLATSISLLALVVSTGALINSCATESARNNRAKREELQHLLVKLEELNIEEKGRYRGQGDGESGSSAQSAPGTVIMSTGMATVSDFRPLVYYESARALASQIPEDVTFTEWLMLSDWAFRLSSFADAECYATKAAEAIDETTATSTDRAMAYASLGALHAERYPDLPSAIEKARLYLEKAQHVFDETPRDQKSEAIEAGFYLNWALLEYDRGFLRHGDIALKKAKDLAPYSNQPSTHREWIEEVDRQVEEAKKTGRERFPTSSNADASN